VNSPRPSCDGAHPPEDVRPLYTRADMHIHTHFSDCAWKDGEPEMTVRNIALAAEKAGYETIGLCDHIHKFTDRALLHDLRRELRETQTNVEILLGCEADVLSPAELTIDEEFAASLDFVALAFTHYQVPWVQIPLSVDPHVVAQHNMRMFAKAVSTPFADVIVHPFYTPASVLGNLRVIISKIDEEELRDLLWVAKENHIAMEFGPKAFRTRMSGGLDRFFVMCKEVGVKLCPGSDAHTLGAIGRLDKMGRHVKRLGLSASDFVIPRKR